MARLRREAAADLAAASEDRLADHRRRDHLVVEHDGEGLAHVVLGELAEPAGAGIVEAEIDDRLVGARIEGRVGGRQLIAAHDRRLAQNLVAFRLVDARIDLETGGNPGGLRLGGRQRGMHLVKAQTRSLADQLLELGGIGKPRHLHENAAGALAHDIGLGGAHGVDAPPHGLDRGRDRIARALSQTSVGGGDREAAALACLHVDIGSGGAENRIAERLHHQLQRLERSIALFGLGDAHLNRVAGNADRTDPDLGLAQTPPRIVAQSIEPVLADVVDLHGEQQMCTPAQVEAEVQLLGGHPSRPAIERRTREEVGQHHEEAHEAGHQDSDLLPTAERQHAGTLPRLTRSAGRGGCRSFRRSP